MMAFKSFPQTKNDRWIIQPRDESDDDFDSVFTAPACLVPPRRPIRNNAGGTWAKLEGKPPFLGHAAVAVFWIAVVSGLLLMLKKTQKLDGPGTDGKNPGRETSSRNRWSKNTGRPSCDHVASRCHPGNHVAASFCFFLFKF